MPTAKYDADANSEVARPRSDFGNHMTATRAFAGKLGASMKPRMNRRVKNTITAADTLSPSSPTKPIRKVAIDQITSVTPYTALVPSRSSNIPPGIWPMT